MESDIRLNELPSWSLLDHANHLLGFGQFYQRFSRAHLGRVVVNPVHREAHIGTQLMRRLIKQAQHDLGLNECSLFVLRDNRPAIGLYSKLGFIEHPYPETLPIKNCIYMRRK